ncbi:MAG: ATP-dependent DNA helicase, partial [Chloroflexota bacterium]
ADGEHCLGPKCAFYRKRTCFLYRARWEAAAAHVVVVNHALLLSQIGPEAGAVLPEYRYLVVDEAHNLEDVATDQLSHTVGRREVDNLLDDVSRESITGGRTGLLSDVRAALRGGSVPALARQEIEAAVERAHGRVDEARQAARCFGETLGEFLGHGSSDSGEYSRRLRLTRAIRNQSGWVQVEDAWEGLSLRLTDLERDLQTLSTNLIVALEDGLPDGERLVQDLDAANSRATALRQEGQSIVAGPDSNYVQWAEDAGFSRRGEGSLRAAPLDVGELLKENLFENREAVVLTSATLSVSGSCDYVATRVGLGGAPGMILDSPFDYKSSTLIYMPSDIPEPSTPGHQKAVERALVELCTATAGRALVLFTSHSQLATTYHAIRRPLQQEEILVLAQRVEGSSRRQLLRTFRSNPRTVLLGSASFWEGVDVV